MVSSGEHAAPMARSPHNKLRTARERALEKLMVVDSDRDPGTDLRGRSSVRAWGRTLRHDGGMGEAGLSRLLHDLLPQYHGALDHG